MIDWLKVNNDKTFQNLVNHLFFLECPSTYGFVPFSPYIGKDGGWDGKYEGYYPKENLEGRYCIQAKYTKHNLKAAMPSLTKWVKTELIKAKKNKVDHLRLATCAQLRDEHITKIEALNKRHVKTFKIWHGQDLTLRIEQEPFLRLYYFDGPSVPLFVPPTIYFEKVETRLANITVPQGIKSVEDRINEVIAFLNDNSNKIFVLSAFGGFGKSHFLSLFPKKVANSKIDREVWFIRDGVRNVQDAMQDEIGVRDSAHKKHKYVFVLDDADRAGDVKDILNCINKTGIDAKLVITLRTIGLSNLEEIIDSIRCRDLTIYKSIPEWSKDELKTLLRAAAQKDKIDNEDEIIRKYPNPYFIIQIGLNIKGRNSFDLQTFKQSIIQSLLNDARKILPTEKGDVGNLLFHLALITPVNINDSQTITKLSKIVDISSKNIEKILNNFDKNGVLRKIGSVLRFIPDMIGDVYLLETMQKIGENERKEAFLYWLDTHSKNIFCNLGATLQYGNPDCLVPVVTDIVSGWIDNATKYGGYEKKQILENLEEICYLVPEKALDMLWAYINTPELSTDDYGLIIIRLIHSDCERQKIVDILEEIRNKVKLGTYDNYKPNTLVRDAVTPLKNNIDRKIIPILDIIEKSLKGLHPIVEFSKAALKEVLASAHEWTYSTYDSVQFSSRFLMVNEPVLLMRKKSIEIVKQMLLDVRPEVRLAGIDIVKEIGECHFGPGVSSDIPLKDRIDDERKEMLEFIDKNNLIEKEKDYHVLCLYEDLLVSWWALQKVSDEISLKLINHFKHDPEYRIFRYYTSRYDITDDIQDKFKNAPVKDRWPWTVDNIMRKWYLTVNDFEKDAVALNNKYSSSEDIAIFLAKLGKSVTVSSANALFLRAWFKQNPEVFRHIRNQKELWANIPLAFKYTITQDLVGKYPEMAKIIIDEVLLTPHISTDEAKIAIDILSYDIPSLNKSEIIKTVAEKNIDDLNLSILERMRFIEDKISAKSMAVIVLNVMNHLSSSFQAKAIDYIAFILHNKNSDYVSDFFGITHDVICQALLHKSELDYHDFEVSAILFNKAGEFFSFIEARLEKESKIKTYSEYKAIPYRGIEFASKFINTKESFVIAIKKALEWERKYKNNISFSVSKLFEQFMSLRDESGTLYFDNVKSEFYNKNDFLEYLQCLFSLPLNKKNLGAFKEAIGKSAELRYEEKMAELLRSKIYPEDGWSSSVGQIPPAFIEKKECFEELKNIAPAGKLRNALEECVRGVDNMINQHKKEEENRSHSR
ncbi:MAG: hypothetical protein LHV68_07315 [Elusimicrobia bacterium]|nr:hypothetical protein [Candidatus Liberimonas magnetica]